MSESLNRLTRAEHPLVADRTEPSYFDFAGARAAVLGGAGFLGGHLINELLHRSVEVIAIDNLMTGKDLLGVLEHPSVTFIEHDIIDPFDIEGELDIIFTLASPASPTVYLAQPVETLLTNSVGMVNTLDLASRKGAKVVLASTSEVYGDPQVHPQPETYWGHVNPIGPRSVYDEGKRYAEALAVAVHEADGLDVSIARIFNTYGPGMRHDDGRAVPAFFAAALGGEPLKVHGDGQQTRSLCYVDDLIRGILLLGRSHLVGPINLGSNWEVTILDLAEIILRITGGSSEIEFVERPVDDPSVRRPDLRLAGSSLGWQPEIDLEQGLAMCSPWFEAALAGSLQERQAG